METYNTLAAPGEGRYVEKKSEFLAYARPLDTEEAALAFLEEKRREHRTARHHVYAYILREEQRERYSDDGEPAQTAGLPVLKVLQHAGLTNSALVVVRYFGGTLLGTGGLVRAYTAAARHAVEAAGSQTFQNCYKLMVCLPYPLFEQARRILETEGSVLEAPIFTDKVTLTCVLPAESKSKIEKSLQELCKGKADITFNGPFFAP